MALEKGKWMSFMNMATSLRIISYKQTELWQTLIKLLTLIDFLGFPVGSDGKEFACNAGDLDSVPGLERFHGEENGYPLHSNLAWRIPGTEEPGRLHSMRSQSRT